MRRGATIAAAVLFALCQPASAQDATWHTYADTARGFSISYPDGWTVNPHYQDQGYAFHLGDADDVRDGLGLTPAIDVAPGTNLESGQLVLAVQPARPGDICKASSFLADAPPDSATQVTRDSPELAATLAQPGDLYTIEHIVVMVSRTPCLAVQYVLVSSRAQPGDPAAKPAFDRAAVLGLLDRIARTIKPLK